MNNQAAPPFTLDTVDNSQISLETFYGNGKPTLLLFFNIGCAGCTGRAIPLTLTFANDYPDLQLLAIHSHFSANTPHPYESVKAVASYFKLPYPVAFDQDDTIFRLYAAEGTPHWILLDAAGKIHKSIFGSMAGARQRLSYSLQELFQLTN